MVEHVAYLEREEWIAPGISNTYTSARCKTSVQSEDDRDSQEAKIDKKYVYAKTQSVQTLRFHESDEAELRHPYLNSYGPTYKLPTYTFTHLPRSIPASDHSNLPQGVKLIAYKPTYVEESGWYEYLTGPETGEFYYKMVPPLKIWKYKWVTRQKEVGIPSISFTVGETTVKASHPWTGSIRVQYYYDRAPAIKQKLKDNLLVEAKYNFYLSPEGYDASSKTIDIFVLPSYTNTYWNNFTGWEKFELWQELDCLLCNPVAGMSAERTPPGGFEDKGNLIFQVNNARITHPTECTYNCKEVCVDPNIVELAGDYARLIKERIKAAPNITIDNRLWNPYNYAFVVDMLGNPLQSGSYSSPNTPSGRLSERIYDPELLYSDEVIYVGVFEKDEDPGEEVVKDAAFAYFMENKKGMILNGNYDRGGSGFVKFSLWDNTWTRTEYRWVYVFVLDLYGPRQSLERPCDVNTSTLPQPYFTCSPQCISKPCEWYQQIYGNPEQGGTYYLSPDIVMPCYVPWICALKEVLFFTETFGFKAGIQPQWGMSRGFGDVEHQNPYIDLNEVNATIIWQMSDVIPFMIPGEYFYFMFVVSFGENSPCQFLYGPSGYFETHCLTSGTILGCGYADGSVGGKGVGYDKDNMWIFNENFRWLVYFKGEEYWLRPSDFAKYSIGDRVFIYKPGEMELLNKTIACKGKGTFTDWDEVQGVQLTSKNVVYELGGDELIIPESLADVIG